VSRSNIKIANRADPNKKSKKISISSANEEIMHPLELKYGKEPPIEIKPEDRWRWH
jgi:hypothetical protein